ncbi:MAG TPA: ABC transporter permease, partial [Blastocatellia bacterium]|nr:ABC transporter permease [Blastocatellia bacterium]
MRLHFEMRVQENIDAGMSPPEARYAAHRQFGNMTLLREVSREMWGFRSIETLAQDGRYGLRQMRKQPVFTIVAVLSLALGIGANTAIFSLIDAVLLKTLPVKDPEQLLLLSWRSGPNFPAEMLSGHMSITEQEASSTSFSYATFDQFRRENQVFSDVIAFAELERLNVGIDGQAELGNGQVVSGNYYEALGVRPVIGRALTDYDDRVADAEPAAVISYGYWQRRFGRDPHVLGRAIYLNGSAFTIVGVAPPGFSGTLEVGVSPDITVPVAKQSLVMPGEPYINKPGVWWLQVIGRLKEGATEEQARASLDVILQQSVAAYKPTSDQKRDIPRLETTSGSRGLSEARKSFSDPLFILSCVVGLVLLIACANVSNLLLARAAARRKEIAMRLAIGASRIRLVRQLLTESLLLALTGGALGLLLAFWTKDLLVAALPNTRPGLRIDAAIDLRVLGFTVGVSLLTGLLFGLVPAFRATRVDLTPILKDNAAGSIKGGSRSLLGKTLVIAQVAMSLVLLVGAGLFVRTLRNLENVDLGFNKENILLFRIDPTLNGYKGLAIADLYGRIAERVEQLPGVRSVSVSNYALISGSASIARITVPGFTPPPGHKPYVYLHPVGASFFETMEIPLLLGRGFGPQDRQGSPAVAIINETFARTYFPDENPIGKKFSFPGSKLPDLEVIGMVKDAKVSRVRDEIPPTYYTPYLQNAQNLRSMTFEVKTSGEPADLVPLVRQIVQEMDGNLPIFNVKTQSEQVKEAMLQERQFAMLSSFFGLLALLLACIGLYGILSYAVARRTNEIGIRMALGAQRPDVVWMVMRETLVLIVIGVAIGLGGAFLSTSLISSMLFGLTAS